MRSARLLAAAAATAVAVGTALSAGATAAPATPAAQHAASGSQTSPPPVHDVQAYSTARKISLRWTNPGRSHFAHTVVRYAAGAHAPRSPHGGHGVTLRSPRSSSANLGRLTADARYAAAVWTRNSAGRYSARTTIHFSTQPDHPASQATVSGTITDSSGAPLQDVDVFAEDDDTGSDGDATTAADGTYTLSLPPGFYYVDIDGSEATGGNSDATGYLGIERTVTVGSQANREIDAQLRPGAAITGHVHDSSGRPLAGADTYPGTLQPYVQSDEEDGFFESEVGGGADTGTDGRYVLKGLDSGATEPCATGQFGEITGGSTDSTGYADNCASTTVAADPGQVTDGPDVTMPSALGGAVAGTVTDTSGRPAEFAAVYVISSNENSEPGFTFTDSSGHYFVNGIHRGSYRVCAEADSEVDASSAATGSRPSCGAPVTVTGGERTHANVHLYGGAALTGRLTDAAGRPVSNAPVALILAGSGGAEWDATTDANGRYLAVGLPGGSYRVCAYPAGASSPGVPTGAESGCYQHNVAQRVHEGSTRIGIDMQLPTGGAITGTTRPATQGDEVDVDATPAGKRFSEQEIDTIADDDGNYRLSGVPTGQWNVCFDDFDFTQGSDTYRCYANPQTGSQSISVRAGHTVTGIDHQFAKRASITVTAKDQAGHPLSGVDAVAVTSCPDFDCDTEPLFDPSTPVDVDGSALTDGSGQVTLTGLHPGDYAVCLFGFYATTPDNPSATGYSDSCLSHTLDITISGSGNHAVTGTLAPAGEVTGRVLDSDGNPVSGVRVRVSNSSSDDYDTDDGDFIDPDDGPSVDPVSASRTGPDGSYVIRGVTPGQQTVCVDASGTKYRDRCLGGDPGSTSGGTTVTVTASEVTQAPDISLTTRPGQSGATDRSAASARSSLPSLSPLQVAGLRRIAAAIGAPSLGRAAEQRATSARAPRHTVCGFPNGIVLPCRPGPGVVRG